MITTIVIPTFNEVQNLPHLVEAVFNQQLPGLRLLVVDDNSLDGTGDIAEQLASQYSQRLSVLHRSGKLGMGTAYIAGFKRALENGADCIGQMDADFSHPPDKILALNDALQNCDVAIGSRYVSGGSLDERWPVWRKGLSRWGNFYARSILGLHMRDVTGGFRLWRRETLLRMPLDRIRSNGYVFQVETAYVADLLGFKFKETPIHFADRRWGKSKMSLSIQVEAAVRVWQLRGMYKDMAA